MSGDGRAGSPLGPGITVVALGDSTTAGTPGFRSPVEVPPDGDGDVSSQFAWWLMRAEPSWRVLNRGISRERTDAIAARVDRDVLAHTPDIAIVLAGVNDVYDGDAAADIEARLSGIYQRVLGAGIPLVACSIIPFDSATPAHDACMHAVNAWIRETAAATSGMAYCDTRAAAARPGDIDRLFETPDGLHPTPTGYRRMADALLPVLQALAVR